MTRRPAPSCADAHGRPIDYLRISVTDQCDQRCVYCQPPHAANPGGGSENLSDDEILHVVRTAGGLGFRKFRITGGEPLLRPGLPGLARRIRAVPGVEALGLSTNGTHLAPLARSLKAAGIRSINVSLDALEPSIYRRITGGEVQPVLDGLRAAQAQGFERIKLNCVLIGGVNEDQIWPLAQFAARQDMALRLIELMPVSNRVAGDPGAFFSVNRAIESLRQRDDLVPAPETRIGHGPAVYYRLQRTGAVVGFIRSMTNHLFCQGCNKIRLTADGKLRPCLGTYGEIDIKPVLRDGRAAELAVRFRQALLEKPSQHAFRDDYQPSRPMVAIGG